MGGSRSTRKKPAIFVKVWTALCRRGETPLVTKHTSYIIGESTKVLEGLYVVDGAIIPTSVGVNPTLTISCVAERCMRLLAEREGWRINYRFRHLGKY